MITIITIIMITIIIVIITITIIIIVIIIVIITTFARWYAVTVLRPRNLIWQISGNIQVIGFRLWKNVMDFEILSETN